VAPGEYDMPSELLYVQLLHETGWPPNVLDEVPMDLIQKYVIYANVRSVFLNGGEYKP